jgi:DNA-binding response OmpR family regulator
MNCQALIADISPIDAAFMRMMLEKNGWKADIVMDMNEVQKKLQENSYALVFVNSQLRKLSSQEAIPQLKTIEKESSEHFVIVAMLNTTLTSERKSVMEAGADFCLLKPIYQNHLQEILKSVSKRNMAAA